MYQQNTSTSKNSIQLWISFVFFSLLFVMMYKLKRYWNTHACKLSIIALHLSIVALYLSIIALYLSLVLLIRLQYSFWFIIFILIELLDLRQRVLQQ